jgi:hypothetical protein
VEGWRGLTWNICVVVIIISIDRLTVLIKLLWLLDISDPLRCLLIIVTILREGRRSVRKKSLLI